MVERLISWVSENFVVSAFLIYTVVQLIKINSKHTKLLAEMRGKYAYWMVVISKSNFNHSPEILSDIQALIKNYER